MHEPAERRFSHDRTGEQDVVLEWKRWLPRQRKQRDCDPRHARAPISEQPFASTTLCKYE